MQSNFFRAPSLPKLGTRRVSSSIFGGGRRSSTPKLNVKNFSFGGEEDFSKTVKNIESTIKKVAEVVNKSTVKINTLESKVNDFDSVLSNNIGIDENNITKTLVETNKILVEIQKQLAYDFAMRIVDEKEAIKRAKTAESKRKFAAKEKSVEGIKKFGSFAENIVDRVTAPIKSVFDRIKEFFGLILTGIVTNAVFTWLGNKENRDKLSTIFDWVGKIFVGLLLSVITFKFIKWGNRLFKLVRFFWRLPGKIKALFDGLRGIIRRIGERLGLKPKSDPTSRTSPGRRRTTTPRSRPRPMGAAPRPSPPSPLLGPSGTPIRSADPLSPYRGAGASRGRAPYVPPKIQVPKKQFRPFNFKGGNIARGGLIALAFFALDLFMPQTQDGISKLYESVGIGIRKMSDQELLDEYKKSTESSEKIKNSPFGDLIDYKFSGGPTNTKNILLREIKRRGLEPPQYSKGGTIKASNGMTVPGRGSKNVDSVNAMLAPGEEVIRTTSAMMFRPLLKDINDNAGRLWDSFSRAIGKLASVSEYQKEVSKEYSKVIKDFDEYLKQEINKKKTKTPSGGGGTRRPKISTEKVKQQPQINTKVSFSSQQTNVRISSSPKITNVNMTPPPSSGGGMTFLPMVLPTQKSKPPQIPTPQNTATDVPFITSANMSNPYMQLTPEMYGIFV
jgi:hypothetical protein